MLVNTMLYDNYFPLFRYKNLIWKQTTLFGNKQTYLEHEKKIVLLYYHYCYWLHSEYGEQHLTSDELYIGNKFKKSWVLQSKESVD